MKPRALLAALTLLVACLGTVGSPALASNQGSWTQLNPAATPPPSARTSQLVAYDAAHGQVVLYGGVAPDLTALNDTWTFDGTTWIARPAGPAKGVALDYDPATGNVVLLAVSPLQPLPNCIPNVQTCFDTWTWDGTAWTQQHPVHTPQCAQFAVYDAVLSRVVASGLCGVGKYPGPGMTWLWDGTDWTRQAGNQLAADGFRDAAAYDPVHHQLVLFGGCHAGPNDTWTYDGLNWIRQHPTHVPNATGCAQVAWDGSQVVAFDSNWTAWAWDGSDWASLPTPARGQPGARPDHAERLAFDGSRLSMLLSPTVGITSQGWTWTSSAFQPRPYTGGHDAVGVPSGATDAYFAEGYTGLGFREYLTVQNPGAAQTLNLQYLNDSGQVITRTRALAAQSRTTIDVGADVGPGQNISTHLSAPNPFIAERPMYFAFTGSNAVRDGGHDAVGASSPGSTFFFAEGYTGSMFNEFLSLANFGAATANLQVTYYFNSGAPPRTVAHTVAPTSRLTVSVNDGAEAGAGQEVSVKIASDQPIVAERPIYFNYNGRTGGHVAMGARTLSQHLNLAEGYVAAGLFDEYLTLLNPNSADAHVTITYNLPTGAPVSRSVTVPAGRRFTEFVNADLPNGTENSIHLDSDQPIVAERPIYFDYNGRNGGHDAVAIDDAALGTTQLFAEGFVSPGFDEFYTILNNTGNVANLIFTLYLEGGGTKTKTVVVPPHSRFTEHVNLDLPPYSEVPL